MAGLFFGAPAFLACMIWLASQRGAHRARWAAAGIFALALLSLWAIGAVPASLGLHGWDSHGLGGVRYREDSAGILIREELGWTAGLAGLAAVTGLAASAAAIWHDFRSKLRHPPQDR